jgi:hypothetical protein
MIPGAVAVGDFKTKALAFDIGDGRQVGFGNAAEPGFPVVVQNNPVDVDAGALVLFSTHADYLIVL